MMSSFQSFLEIGIGMTTEGKFIDIDISLVSGKLNTKFDILSKYQLV